MSAATADISAPVLQTLDAAAEKFLRSPFLKPREALAVAQEGVHAFIEKRKPQWPPAP